MFRAAIEGNLEEHMKRERNDGGWATKSAVRVASNGLKRQIRAQTVKAGLDRDARPGKSVSKTWQSQVYPARRVGSFRAASTVYSKWPRAIAAFEDGAIISGRNGARWLAVPTPAVGRKGNRRLRPGDFRGALDFVPTRKPGVALLVLHSKWGKSQVMFLLYRQVHIRKRLEFGRLAANWEARLPELIVSEWDKRDRRNAAATE
ncbi:DUF6441 family protein [Paludisphaera rhizosphaerae]|uniref:DUF6441 family protein n=1 Tax=Paludisphaera rhizosphaerae TaxID=2711216 RepID=UPI0013EDBBB1|nr:DUF6441 family protein [Paludisphaera rhizosphaerae]